MVTPFLTERLLLRRFQPDDGEGLFQRRNDPLVARYQDWELPYPRERADHRAMELAAMEEPENDKWWMAVICDRESGEVIGDLGFCLSWQGRTAEVGYTLGSAFWGKGYAVEALTALLAYLFDDRQVTRVFGMLHPDNPASAMVLERTGFLFEGHTKASFWVGEENSDDWIYGLTRPDWEAWRNRPRGSPETVELVEITVDNQPAVARLRAHKSQERFVAPMSDSFADALFPEIVDGAPVEPWMRAVSADGGIVGFVMLALHTEHHPEPFLWRLLIDRLHQRRGLGTRVIELVAEECEKMGDETLLTSWTEGKGSPQPFYLRHGFQPTGRVIDGEIEARKQLPLSNAR